MGTQTAAGVPQTSWHSVTRIAFRFCFAYVGLYVLATQLSGGLFPLPNAAPPGLGAMWPMREITLWLAGQFHVVSPLAFTGNSLDTAFYWVQTWWILIVALIVTAVWSVIDGRRRNYVALHHWFRLVLRFGLAAQMFYYGMAKVIPTQFPFPSLTTLLEPVGNLSLQGMLWTSIGASPTYQIFTGCAEVLAGILLIVPRTALFGLLIALVSLIQVFVLNMTYDVGVKLVSFHLILVTIILLAPDLPRLTAVLFEDRPELFRTRRASRAALVAQIVFGMYLLGMYTYTSSGWWYAQGGGGFPRSALYGVWNVDRLVVDGSARPAVLNDYDRRWRRVIFDAARTMAVQRTDDSFANYGASVDPGAQALALSKGNGKTWTAHFTFQRPAPDRLILEGEMDGHTIRAELQRLDFDTFRLLNSAFRWIRPPDPFAG